MTAAAHARSLGFTRIPGAGCCFSPFACCRKSLSWTLTATAAVTAAPVAVPVRVFARGFALRARQTAWLLGAGASADAGVPTAGQLIDELLAVLYCSENGIRHADLTAGSALAATGPRVLRRPARAAAIGR